MAPISLFYYRARWVERSHCQTDRTKVSPGWFWKGTGRDDGWTNRRSRALDICRHWGKETVKRNALRLLLG